MKIGGACVNALGGRVKRVHCKHVLAEIARLQRNFDIADRNGWVEKA